MTKVSGWRTVAHQVRLEHGVILVHQPQFLYQRTPHIVVGKQHVTRSEHARTLTGFMLSPQTGG